MRKYPLKRVITTVVVVSALILSAYAVPFGRFTTATPVSNNPPYEPSNPSPANGSTDINITCTLTWTGGDPDGDPVTYDVYFGMTSPPVLVAANQSATEYDPGLMNYSTLYYWKIIAWDNQSANTSGPVWEFTTEPRPNNPPCVPNTPSPAHNTTGVALTTMLSWEGGDPDNDTVCYDVYFGAISTPPLIAANHTTTTYDPGMLAMNTTYYWMIIAWDSYHASAAGPLWKFTTIEEGAIVVTIERPLPNHLYIQDVDRHEFTRINQTIVYGPITINASATADAGIDYMELWIDGVLKETFNASNLTYHWKHIIQFNGLSLTHKITVVAFDTLGQNTSTELNVTTWRFHPLPFILAGVAFGSTLVPHTKIKGFVFNLKQTGAGISFFALHIKYTTVGLLKVAKGTVNLKRVRVNAVLGPVSMLKFGPLNKFTYISCTILGGLPNTVGGRASSPGSGLVRQLLSRK
ncbi:MAG: hypothetical protein JXA00_02355 [Candidatus Thermoplasmatota archaeon]|nr:hypothetical protein [Candidatus Thermoplasmatota archaeon]